MSDNELSSIVEFSSDISKQEAPEPLPTGTYHGVIRQVEVKMSQRDTKYAAVAFHISPDQYPADFKDGNPDGTILTYRRVGLEDNAQARFGTRRFCEAIGAPMSKTIDTSIWLGMEASLEITHEVWEEVKRATIQRVLEA